MRLKLRAANRVGPFPAAPYALLIQGLQYTLGQTPGLTYSEQDQHLHWDVGVRGYPLPADSEVEVLFDPPQAQPPQSSTRNLPGPSPDPFPSTDINQALTGPKSVTIDTNTIVERGGEDLIKLDEYQRATQALRSGSWLPTKKLIPPGSV